VPTPQCCGGKPMGAGAARGSHWKAGVREAPLPVSGDTGGCRTAAASRAGGHDASGTE
jgi:hypothetical protein